MAPPKRQRRTQAIDMLSAPSGFLLSGAPNTDAGVEWVDPSTLLSASPPVPIEVLGVWDEATAYVTGDVVSWTAGPYFTLVRAVADSTGETPSVSVESDIFINAAYWEWLWDSPRIVYEGGRNDPRGTGDLVRFQQGTGTATGGTVTFAIVYGAGVLPLEITLPANFDLADIEAAFAAALGEFEFASPENGVGIVQGVGMLVNYPPTVLEVIDDSLTWDGDPGNPSVYISGPGVAGVGWVPGIFLGADGDVWEGAAGSWYRLLPAMELLDFATALSTAADIAAVNAAGAALVDDLNAL